MLDHKIFSKWKIDEIEENLKNNLNLVCLLERPILDKYVKDPERECTKKKPKNLTAWISYYLNEKQNINSLKKNAEQLMKETNCQYTLNECYNALLIKALYKPYFELLTNQQINEELKRYNIKLWDQEKRERTSTSNSFKNTNITYNKHSINRIINIGNCMYLINQSSPYFQCQWENYYLQSGNKYDKEKRNIEKEIQDTHFKDEREKEAYEKKLKGEYGRSIDDLVSLSKEYLSNLRKDNPDFIFSLEEVFNHLYIRAIDKTYIGYLRECVVEQELKNNFEKYGFTIKKPSTKKDIKYAVDFEIYKGKKLCLGIQVKGSKYKKAKEQGNKSLRIAEEYAIQAHKKYKDKYKVDTEWIYVDNKFEILDKEDIMAEIKRKIMRRPVLERYCLS